MCRLFGVTVVEAYASLHAVHRSHELRFYVNAHRRGGAFAGSEADGTGTVSRGAHHLRLFAVVDAPLQVGVIGVLIALDDIVVGGVGERLTWHGCQVALRFGNAFLAGGQQYVVL